MMHKKFETKTHRKRRVFLGGYINANNAQNLNCRALAKYLDKEKYEIGAMMLYSGDLPEEPFFKRLRLFWAKYPHRLTQFFAYTYGIVWSDIAYLPKGQLPGWTSFLAKTLRKPTFITVEGIINDQYITFCRSIGKDPFKPLAIYKKYDYIFAITKFIKRYMGKRYGIEFEEPVLHLGVDTDIFSEENPKTEVNNAVIIGNALMEKGLDDFLKLSNRFERMHFHIVGSGYDVPGGVSIRIENRANVHYHGVLDPVSLSKLLKKMDIHIFPSRTEGFPKVIIETAAAGLPTLTYSDYGAKEWIDSWSNGIVVESFEELEKALERLTREPKTFEDISIGAFTLAERFSWKRKVKEWERAIDEILNEKGLA